MAVIRLRAAACGHAFRHGRSIAEKGWRRNRGTWKGDRIRSRPTARAADFRVTLCGHCLRRAGARKKRGQRVPTGDHPHSSPSTPESTATSMAFRRGGSQPGHHICPRCGGSLYRIHRQPRDRLASTFQELRRYRCRARECGWEGLLRPSHSASRRWTSIARSPGVWVIVAILAIALLVFLVPAG